MKNQTLIRNDNLYIEAQKKFYDLLKNHKLKIYSYSNIIKLHKILMKCNQVLSDSDIKIIVSFDESVKHNRYLEVFNRLRQLQRILTDVYFYLDKKEQKTCKEILNWIELNEKINTI